MAIARPTNRVQLSKGGYVPQTAVTFIQLVPVEVMQIRPPPGCQIVSTTGA
jgi:hypothetical protein